MKRPDARWGYPWCAAIVLCATGCGPSATTSEDASADAGGLDGPSIDAGSVATDGGERDAAIASSCTDMARNGRELGVDCGGPDCPPCERIEIADYYVSPDGDDSNPGTIEQPFATWGRLSGLMLPGQLAYIRGGTYYVNAPLDSDVQERFNNLNGTPGEPIRIFAYPGESPVLDFSDRLREVSASGLYVQDASYLHLRGLRITGLLDNPAGFIHSGLAVQRVRHGTFERIEVDRIGGYGFVLLDGAHDNLFLNCDAHHLADVVTGYENANGFGITGGVDATRNVFDGCRVWWAADDGFDLFGVDGHVTIRNCWAFWNGYRPGTFEVVGDGMGFKLGPTRSYCCGGPDVTGEVLRVVTHNLAFENAHGGFDQNGGLTIYELYNNTSYGNDDVGYAFGYDTAIRQRARNNIAYGSRDAYSGSELLGDHNSWNAAAALTDGDFESVDSTGMDGPRGPNGELPNLPFLRPRLGSSLIDAGTDVGLSYSGAAPDLGCFER